MSKYDEIITVLARPIIERIEAIIMATAEELQQQVAAVKTSLTDAIARVEEDVQNLKDQLGDAIDPTALDPISQGLTDLKNSLDALDPVPNPVSQERSAEPGA